MDDYLTKKYPTNSKSKQLTITKNWTVLDPIQGGGPKDCSVAVECQKKGDGRYIRW